MRRERERDFFLFDMEKQSGTAVYIAGAFLNLLGQCVSLFLRSIFIVWVGMT